MAKLDIILAILAVIAVRAGYFNPPRLSYKFWRILVIINFFILLNFVADSLFLAQRYAVTLTITLLLAVPFTLNHLYIKTVGAEAGFTGKFKWIACLALIAIIGINGLMKTSSRGHLKEAAQWVRQHSNPGNTLFTNSRLMAFYSGIPTERIKRDELWVSVGYRLTQGIDAKYDFLLLDIGDNPPGRDWMDRTVGRKPDATFKNLYESYVYIYRRRKP